MEKLLCALTDGKHALANLPRTVLYQAAYSASIVKLWYSLRIVYCHPDRVARLYIMSPTDDVERANGRVTRPSNQLRLPQHSSSVL